MVNIPSPDPTVNITVSPDISCDSLDLETLYGLGVRRLAKYTQREVIAYESPSIDRLSTVQRINTPLLETNRKPTAETTRPEGVESQDRCLDPVPIKVQVPVIPQRADASHVDFGVATTVARLDASLAAFSHWASYTNARIFALVEPDNRQAEVQAKADALGINLIMTRSHEPYNHRYFLLIRHLAHNARDRTRWSCIIDDDTFFMSMTNLVQALSKHDDSKPVYLGGISESVAQVGVFGLMGFGGAGVFLSRPLLTQLDAVFDSCQTMDLSGDQKISYCIYQNTDTRLTIEHGLHQLDTFGDLSGFFEATGRELPLSVHHWKSWFDTDMTKLSAISEICGDTCLLGQWMFSDKWILTNGYSVIQYSNKIDPDDKAMEKTWDNHNGATFESYFHEFGPLREKDRKKFSYRLHDATVENGQVRQWYIHKDSSKGDQVLELIWRKG